MHDFIEGWVYLDWFRVFSKPLLSYYLTREVREVIESQKGPKIANLNIFTITWNDCESFAISLTCYEIFTFTSVRDEIFVDTYRRCKNCAEVQWSPKKSIK